MSNLCECAYCGEIVPLHKDCFCDRLEKGTLTGHNKKWLKENPDYKH